MGWPCPTAIPINKRKEGEKSMTLYEYYDRKIPDYYPTIKSWFLDNFKHGFTVEKAKREIAEHKLNERKTKVRAPVKVKMVKPAPAAVVEMPTASNF